MDYFKLMPMIFKLVKFVEEAIAGKSQGHVKKSLVLGIAQTIMEMGAAVSGEDKAAVWKKMEKPISQIIDATVGVANATGWTIVQDDAATAA